MSRTIAAVAATHERILEQISTLTAEADRLTQQAKQSGVTVEIRDRLRVLRCEIEMRANEYLAWLRELTKLINTAVRSAARQLLRQALATPAVDVLKPVQAGAASTIAALLPEYPARLITPLMIQGLTIPA